MGLRRGRRWESRRDPVVVIEQGGRGGVADYTRALVEALVAMGQPVELVTARDHRHGTRTGATVHAIIHYLRPTSRLRRTLRRLGAATPANALGFLLAMPRTTALARRCGMVHLQGGYPPLWLVPLMLWRFLGAAVVYTPHNTFARYSDFPRAQALVYERVARVIVHAQADLAELDESVRERAVVLPHGEYGGLARRGGRAARGSARQALGLAGDDVAVLLFGQLRPDKGIVDLLRAAREVPELRVVLAGEDLGALDEARVELGDPALSGRVILRSGFASLPETAELFAAADVAALPYARASQSGVLLLAYAFACPVVVYPVGGLPEAVRERETGWICASSSPPALAAALRDVVAVGPEERRRRGLAGERLAATEYAWSEIARRTERVYEEAARWER